MACPGGLPVAPTCWVSLGQKSKMQQHLVQLSLCFGMVLGCFAKNFARAISKVLHKLFHLKNSEHSCSVTRKEKNISSFLWLYTPLHYNVFPLVPVQTPSSVLMNTLSGSTQLTATTSPWKPQASAHFRK